MAKVTGEARPVERRLWAYTKTASINQRNQKTAGSSQELLGLADSSQPSGGGGGRGGGEQTAAAVVVAIISGKAKDPMEEQGRVMDGFFTMCAAAGVKDVGFACVTSVRRSGYIEGGALRVQFVDERSCERFYDQRCGIGAAVQWQCSDSAVPAQ